MRHIKEVLRLRFELKLDLRQIARSCSMSPSTVHDLLNRATEAGVGWNSLDRQPVSEACPPPCSPAPVHDNIRGPEYFE